ncbi:MAG: hypothetical protein CGU29_17310 [Candidatus Dactylopiibacterium carminicum]|uniref:Uncharacterized protein n=2 Tax=Candidatus Dactylopiibacterium carminicum TaxID=857335 RepID=A0A272EMG4_9RHOO|nr:hypothetical protein BGI27_17595 [Candidatus Dactylopiibacterium carminicum]PAS91282.1 MAG: hypothetical protein CGU29_17310 [Candidatus Dactylopiibacterium carminicum]PAS93474.1 MAG: hypothetical protein BSR46_17645 [Candidatus Dactylopiibacterium carminicum]
MPAPGGPCIDDYPQAIYLFQHPSWRRAFNVKDLQQMFYDIQRLAQVQHERDRAKRELEAATEALHAAEARAEYYRQQLRAESRLGLMLTRLAAI